MSRNKTIFKEDILNAAEKFIVEKNVGELTARALSKYMNISTQPLYAEFTNMATLKNELFSKIYDNLEHNFLSKEIHKDPIINLSLNYINFACDNPKLFKTIYLEQHGDSDMSVNEFSYHLVRRIIKDKPVYSELSKKQIDQLITSTWVVSTGFANLIATGSIEQSETQIISFLETTIDNCLTNKYN